MTPPIAFSIDELVGRSTTDKESTDDVQELKRNLQSNATVNTDKGRMKPLAGRKGDQNIEETFKLPERYKYIKLLGHGAYGMVCCAMDMHNCYTVAVKRINQIDSLLVAKRTLRELKLLRHFQGQPNIIQLIDVFEVDTKDSLRFDKLFIVQELMDSDLCHIISSKHPISDELIRSFMHQLLQGLQALHDAEVLHRDLKPGNLLWKQNGTLKICDFGLARGISEAQEAFDATSMTNYVATRWYRPPEILLYRAKYGKSCMPHLNQLLVDIWSVGCIFAELLGRRVFLPGQSGVEQLNLILRKVGFPSEEEIDRIPSPKSQMYLRRLPRPTNYPLSSRFPTASPQALDLLERLLKFNPETRISCAEALRHPYFTGLPLAESRPKARFNFDFDAKCETLKDIKSQILSELALYHKPAVEHPLHYIDEMEVKEKCRTSSPTSILKRLGFGRSSNC